MNYLLEIRRFHEVAPCIRATAAERLVWFGLMNFCNNVGWEKRFTVSITALQLDTGLSRNGVVKGRDKLVEHGLIKYFPRGLLAAEYEMVSVVKLFERKIDFQE